MSEAATRTWPPQGFSYGNRMLSGNMERHPVLPKDERTVEKIQAALIEKKRLTVPDVIRHDVCTKRTLLGMSIAETLLLAKNFKPYGRLFCAACKNYFPLESFTWAEDGQRIA